LELQQQQKGSHDSMNGPTKPSLTMKSGDRIPPNPWGKDERRSNGKGGKENKQKFHRRGDKLEAY
jgi:hypothetical protein